MDCPNIGEIKFSSISLDAIEDIKSRNVFADMLVVTMGMGTVVNIFLGNDLTKASYSVYSSDFEGLAQSMVNIPSIKRERITFIADMTALRVTDYKEQMFWRAISYGCKINK